MKEKIVIPFAPILVESTRSIGYSFESALADIIDNSIGKNATEVHIEFSSIDPQYVAVIDNACGMNASELEAAMRYGSKSSLDARDPHDLGRFGLGLKTASMSQCRRLTVITKKDGRMYAACWDLDVIAAKGNWVLTTYTAGEIAKLMFADRLKKQKSGTVVIWQEFDRIANGSANPQKVFDEKIERAREHAALVFHRFMDGESIKNRVRIYFNGSCVEPIDPFLSDNPATQPLPEQTIRIGKSQIQVKPYILPFASKVSAKDKRKLGELCDLRQNQGFYIYRNKRLIIWGTWFRLIKQHELNKLARVRVDIPNTLDSMWEIDIKKSTASLPDVIKRNLVTVVQNAVGRSEIVYKYRGRKVSNDSLQHVWNTVDNRGQFQYLVNRDLPLYKLLERSLDERALGYLDAFIKTLEDTFPYGDVYYRLAKDDSSAKTSSLDFEEAYRIAETMLGNLKVLGLDTKSFLDNMDTVDFFVKHPDVVKKIREDYAND